MRFAAWIALMGAAACASYSEVDANVDAGTPSIVDAGVVTDSSPTIITDGSPIISLPDTGPPELGPPPPLPRNVIGGSTYAGVINSEAAFDGDTTQSAGDSAQVSRLLIFDKSPLLYREFECAVTMHRVKVYAPTPGYFMALPDGGPSDAGTGKMTLVGRKADGDWEVVATQDLGSTSPVVFDEVALASASTAFVAYGVSIEPGTFDATSTLRVAEIEMWAECTGAPSVLTWSTTPWICDAVCVTATNPGTLRRTTYCTRGDGGTAAADGLCDSSAKPALAGAGCEVKCPYTLSYIGARDFTASADWLHTGSVSSGVGPLPDSVSLADNKSAITGKRCSIKTPASGAYYTAFFCSEPNNLWCAFKCL